MRGCAPRGARFTSPAQPLARPRVLCSTLRKVSRNAQALLQRLFLRRIALSQHATGFLVHICMCSTDFCSTKSPNSAREPALTHATCQPHRCQVRFCFQELQLPYKAKSMYSLSSMELFFCNCLAMCSARCRLHMASLLSPSHSVTHVDPVVLALLRSSSFEVHVSAEGGSAPLCPTLNPYLPIKGLMGCKSGTLDRPTTGDPTHRMLPSPPCADPLEMNSQQL